LYIPDKTSLTEEKTFFKGFIDYDKKDHILYNNIFLEDEIIVVKIPFNIPDESGKNIKIEKFNLANHTFLTSY
jgi:hypothetical protein